MKISHERLDGQTLEDIMSSFRKEVLDMFQYTGRYGYNRGVRVPGIHGIRRRLASR